jgi:hypothetical protein
MSKRKLTEAERLLMEKHEALAHEYESHMGDVTHWSAPLDIKVPGGEPISTFSVPFEAGEMDYLFDVAAAEDLTLGEFIRQAALDAAKARTKRHKASSPRKD